MTNLIDAIEKSDCQLTPTLNNFCFDHNIWWENFQIFENFPWKGKKNIS